MKQETRYNILLICYVSGNGNMDMPYILHRGGCNIEIYSKKDSWLLKNNIPKIWHEAKQNEDDYLNDLLSLIESKNYEWIIPVDDEIIRIINKKCQTKEQFYKLLNLCHFDFKSFLGSKIGLSEWCKKLHISVPKFLIYKNDLSLSEINEKLQFPILIKEDENAGGFGNMLCINNHELKETIRNLDRTKEYIFQEYILGEEISCEALFKNGNLLVVNSSKILDKLGQFGYSLVRSYYKDLKTIDLLTDTGKKLGLNGFCSISYMQNPVNNDYYLIEIDSRPNAWFRLGDYTTNNFSIGVKKYLLNELSLLNNPKQPKQKIIALFMRDLASTLNKKGFSKFFYWLINLDGRWQYIPFYDKKLLTANILFLINRYFNWVLKKIQPTK